MLRGQAEVERNLDRWYQGKLARVATAMQEIAAILEGYAKSNHEWRDRTGATTTGIRGFISEATPQMVSVVLAGSMDYNIFLELARDGKWSWLWPAVEANLDLIKSKLRSIME